MRLKPLIWIYEASSGNVSTEIPNGKIEVIEDQWDCIRIEITPENKYLDKIEFKYFESIYKGVQRAEEWYRDNFKTGLKNA